VGTGVGTLVGVDDAVVSSEMVATPEVVATAAMVRRSSGVVYVARSSKKETLEKGRLDTGEASGKTRRSEAGAEGSREARSNSPGANTLSRTD
jgi:hypothetical protein